MAVRRWCAYQERSHHETRQKLRSLGASPEETETMIAELIAENFLNEERFAMAFAGGRFRIKQWGRVKIRQGLREHRVSEASIERALNSIGSSDYERAIRLLAGKKIATLMNPDRRQRYHITMRYLVGKGFESELARETLNGLLGEAEEHEFRT